jgi:hypothetical protein
MFLVDVVVVDLLKVDVLELASFGATRFIH